MTVTDRAVYGTKKYRAEDLVEGDVVRNRYGKWDVIVAVPDKPGEHYIEVQTEVGGALQLRRVHLVDVQYAKPS